MNLTEEDCKALLAIISNARITGADAQLVARLQNKLLFLAERAQRDQERDPHHGDLLNPGGTA